MRQETKADEKTTKKIKELWEERNKGRYLEQIVILLYVIIKIASKNIICRCSR